jgi:hypothetical protein
MNNNLESLKPTVPAYVADWFEIVKVYSLSDIYNTICDDMGSSLRSSAYNISQYNMSLILHWVDNLEEDLMVTLVNMKQFGYNVEDRDKKFIIYDYYEDMYIEPNDDISDNIHSAQVFDSKKDIEKYLRDRYRAVEIYVK